MITFLCAHAELWSAIAGALGSIMLAVPYFVEWGHRRTREERIRRRRRAQASGTHDPIATALISGSTDAVLAAGTTRALVAGIGAVLLVVSFFLLIFFSASCGR
jgi:VIT1/CCC1 family predicted Fe2+/Mn2+ transporter